MLSYAGRNRFTVNFLKTLYFDNPEWTLCRVGLMPATWMKYREALEELVLAHPRIFPGYVRGERDYDALPSPLYAGGLHTDCWGIVWQNIEPGLDSIPVVHPLADWSALEGYVPPNPLTDAQFGPRDWEAVAQEFQAARTGGDLAVGSLPHGFLYMLLYYLRGFENFMLDLAEEEARLGRVIEMLDDYNVGVSRRFLELGAEMLSYGEDLGMQSGLPISPAMWRRYIKPSFARLFSLGVEAGLPVRMHTDGYILDIIPDLIECGVTLLNPQIRPNGVDGLRRTARGKVAIDQDLDRQLFPFATPSQIEDHIGEVYEGLYNPAGGLMLYAECEPDLSLEQIEAICTALERICRPPLLD
jgi:uroporphyrinogen decarboxylase